MSIFITILIGLFLVIFNFMAVKKQKGSFADTLNYKQENMGELQLEMGKMRKEFAETVLELQEEIEELKNKIDTKENTKIDENIDKEIFDDEITNVSSGPSQNEKAADDKEQENSNNVKVNEIEKLVKKGLSVEEIAEELGIGKGEVLLIKELFIR